MSEEIRDPRDRERSPEEISEWLATAKDPTTPPGLLVSLTSDPCTQIACAAQRNPNLPSDFLRLAIFDSSSIYCWANPLAMQAALELGDRIKVETALCLYFAWKPELDDNAGDFSALKMVAEGWWRGNRRQVEHCFYWLKNALGMENEAAEMALKVALKETGDPAEKWLLERLKRREDLEGIKEKTRFWAPHKIASYLVGLVDEKALSSALVMARESLFLELFPTFPLAHLISTGEDPSHG